MEWSGPRHHAARRRGSPGRGPGVRHASQRGSPCHRAVPLARERARCGGPSAVLPQGTGHRIGCADDSTPCLPTRDRAAYVAVLLATACAEQPQTSSPDASVSASPTTAVTPTPTEGAATAEPTSSPTPAPPTSSSATFSLLPAVPPAGDAAEITCSGDIGPSDPVAIVSLKGTQRVAGPTVMRDYSDPAHPRTVCDFGSGGVTQLIDARHVVIESCPGAPCIYAVVDLPEVRYHWFALPTDANTSGRIHRRFTRPGRGGVVEY